MLLYGSALLNALEESAAPTTVTILRSALGRTHSPTSHVPRRHHTAPALQQPVSRSNDRFLNLLVVLGLGVARLNREAREAQALHGTVSFVSAATKMDVRYVHLNLARTRSGRRLTLALSARRQRFSCCLSSETSTKKVSRQGT